MGIDVYMQWRGQTSKEKDAQITGFSVRAGDVGYLREAYHGGPYATKVLCPEAFAAEDCKAQIPAKVLKERLPDVIAAAIERERTIYKSANVSERHPVVKAYKDFVKLAEKVEKATGEPVTIYASY